MRVKEHRNLAGHYVVQDKCSFLFQGICYTAYPGFVTDFMSAPTGTQWLLKGKNTREAALIHDILFCKRPFGALRSHNVLAKKLKHDNYNCFKLHVVHAALILFGWIAFLERTEKDHMNWNLCEIEYVA